MFKNISTLTLLALLCNVLNLASCIKQELRLEEDDGNYLFFSNHVPLASNYDLSRVTRFCCQGAWMIYSEPNYNTLFDGIGQWNVNYFTCAPFNGSEIKSFRFWGANETEVDAISLYAGLSYTGEEIFVTGRAYAGISHPIKTIAASGDSDWTLFEGQNLDGKSICWTVPFEPFYHFNWDVVSSLNLETVGSVFKGCDLKEIELYKKEFNL